MSKRIVCFGEIMMRLNPESYLRFVQADKFECSYAGGEANVAVSLANYGMDASYVTKLPDNPLGAAARNEVRRFGVDTKDIVWGGPRLRAGSSIATASRKDFDWAKIFKGAKWFHFTGITPALGGECPAICLDALKYCKAHKITVSCDLNYRGKLWTREQAGATMAKLVPYVDVCIANEADAADVFGIKAEGTDVDSGKLDKEGYVSVARQLATRFGCKKVAITLRPASRPSTTSRSSTAWAAAIPSAAASSTPSRTATARRTPSTSPWPRRALSTRSNTTSTTCPCPR